MNPSVTCRNCGTTMPATAHFCHVCGRPLPSPETLPQLPRTPHGASEPRWLRLAAFSLLGISIVLLATITALTGLWALQDANSLPTSKVNRNALVGPTAYFATTADGFPLPTTNAIRAELSMPFPSPTPTLFESPLFSLSPESVTLVPLATFSPPPETTPLPDTTAAFPLPTDLFAVTVAPSLQPTPVYDLYVRRIEFVESDSLETGQPVHFNVLLATDLYPPQGPFFPTTYYRWRADSALDWQQGLCRASDRFASCFASFDVTYLRAGSYDVSVEVDPRNEIPETDEANNSRTLTIRVGASEGVPTSTVTRTQTVKPTPLPTAKPQPVFSAVTFSSGFDDTAMVPLNPARSFAYGVKIIYAYWTYNGVVPDTAFEYEWLRNGVHLDGSGERFISISGKSFQWLLYGYTPTTPLDAGNYQFIVRVKGQVILSGTFVIEPPQIGGPVAGAITVFFTIQNGSPTGWVYDRQGVQHIPQYGTISGIRVQPGDHIVLQTDQPRFSLLFDCSTTPDTFEPCNFSADSALNLPSEIWALKPGMNGYLNISRADNWAGYRSGFEPQRYPADPVLRIVLTW